jgi:hypothetical protein
LTIFQSVVILNALMQCVIILNVTALSVVILGGCNILIFGGLESKPRIVFSVLFISTEKQLFIESIKASNKPKPNPVRSFSPGTGLITELNCTGGSLTELKAQYS